jgi:hypothetical protein
MGGEKVNRKKYFISQYHIRKGKYPHINPTYILAPESREREKKIEAT